MVLANVKQSISGTYHAIKQAKYACRYLDEAAYQFNRRFRLPELLPRLLRAMMLWKPCAETLPVVRVATGFYQLRLASFEQQTAALPTQVESA